MERRLAAILAIDMVGYSRLMAANEAMTISRQKCHREGVIDPQIAEHRGRIVKTTGDGLLAEFPSVVNAVDCAMAFQEAIANLEENEPEETRIAYRGGINLGDIVIDDEDILGDGVNLAARLESIAPPGGLCLSDMVRQNLRGPLGEQFQDIGEQSLKNIDRRVRVWRWPADPNIAANNTASSDPSLSKTADPSVRATIELPPFKNLTAKPEQRDLALGFAEDIAANLMSIDTLKLLYDNGQTKGEEARYRLEGTLRSSGSRLRCNIQFLDKAAGQVLWSGKFDGDEDSIFDFQDHIAEEVMAMLELELSEGQQSKTWRREAGNSEAYNAFLEGRTAYKEYLRPGIARAKSAFEQALLLSPGFHGAALGLARCHIEDATFGWSDSKEASLEKAQSIIDRVLAIDHQRAGGRLEQSHLLMVRGQFDAARLEAEMAVALDPNQADCHNCLAHVLLCLGLPDEAMRAARRSISLNPGTPDFYLVPLTQAYIDLQRYQEALALCEQLLSLRPAWAMAYVQKILALGGLGRKDEAKATAAQILNIIPRFTITRWHQTIFFPDRHDIPAAMKCLAEAGLPA